jgi:hypothetical protein
MTEGLKEVRSNGSKKIVRRKSEGVAAVVVAVAA